MKNAEKVRAIYDDNSSDPGWFVRYDQPGAPVGGIALDERMDLDGDADDEEIIEEVKDALAANGWGFDGNVDIER